MAGPYRAAVQKGLHKQLLKLFQKELEEVNKWWSYTGIISSQMGTAVTLLVVMDIIS